jgi:hypothetical protein
VNWLYGGYFCGWYVLLGVGFVRWLTQDPSHRESWWMVAFGVVAYFLLIPSMLFGLMPVLEKLSARAEPVIREGITRRAVSRGYAFAVGLVGSLVAMVTCFVGWLAAAMAPEALSTDNLGETGAGVVIVSMMMGTLAVIAACLWLGLRLLLLKCQAPEPGARRTWSSRIAPALLALAWAGTLGWIGYRLANATSVMVARLDFAALPASDEPLEEWLRSQPGVVAAAVSRQGDTVVVECAMSAHRSHSFSRWGDTVLIEYTTSGGEKRSLHLTQVAAEAGYGGLRKVEFDKPKRHW